mmetsp:Transcript_15068/g.45169  ORF Transcript_15068/g.45169 Transcript_15068/m.45169 type:complete len:224 (-) Transcript_15068:141-812(-)
MLPGTAGLPGASCPPRRRAPGPPATRVARSSRSRPTTARSSAGSSATAAAPSTWGSTGPRPPGTGARRCAPRAPTATATASRDRTPRSTEPRSPGGMLGRLPQRRARADCLTASPRHGPASPSCGLPWAAQDPRSSSHRPSASSILGRRAPVPWARELTRPRQSRGHPGPRLRAACASARSPLPRRLQMRAASLGRWRRPISQNTFRRSWTGARGLILTPQPS